MNLIQLANISEIKEDEIFESHINGEAVILVKNKNSIKAYNGLCPHQGAQLVYGELKDNHIICPKHGKHFSCETGKENKSALCLQEYKIKIKDGNILFDESQLLEKDINEINIPLKEIKDLPMPKGKFISGNLSDFSKENKHQIIEEWVKEVGELFKISLMGKKFVVSANPDFNAQILKERPLKFRRFSKIKEVMEEMGIYGVFSAEGNQWKQHRRITAEALSLKNVKAYFPTIKQMTERLHKRWNNVNNNEVIDIQQEMMLYTVDITTFIAFGYDTNTLESDGDVIQNHLKKIFPMLNKRMTAPLPLWRYYKTKKDKELDLALKGTEELIDEFIQTTKKRLDEQPELKENPTNFLEALLVEQEKDKSFTDKDVYGNVFSMLLAGEDTTSNTISWAMYYLSQYPEVKQKIREEADTILKNEKLPSTSEQLDALKYTEAVSLEALRIKPTTPMLIMEPNEDVVIQNLNIPKGTTIILQNKVAQTDAHHFFDPEKFIPERWMTNGCPANVNHNPDVIHVFGGGPRYCPGKNLAIHEMKMALAMICKNFDFDLVVDTKEIKELFAFTMYPENLKMKIKARQFATS